MNFYGKIQPLLEESSVGEEDIGEAGQSRVRGQLLGEGGKIRKFVP